ncbi:MAG: lipoyl(octanoyl) transferase LipB [Candidatus Binatia bacterium]
MELIVRDLGRCPYATALALQEDLVSRKVAGDAHDYLLVLEHELVYTLGRGANAADLLGADRTLGIPAFRVSRGGGVTFHGPGQLVAYPILTLRHARDVHRYVHSLEEVLIRACAGFGLAAARRDGLTGVWVGAAKIASIGVGVRRWTTFHGIALNVSTDMRFFAQIVPCRMPELRLTSMAIELGTAPPMADVQAAFVHEFRSVFGYADARCQEECRA